MFWKSFGNTFVYCLVVVPGSVFLGLGLALLIEGDGFGRGFYRAAYFLPVTSTLIAMAVVWEFLLHPSVGLVNIVLEQVGITGGDWLKIPAARCSPWPASASGSRPGSTWCCSWRA